MTTVAVGLAVLAGLAGSVQVAVMGRFGDRIGVVEALAFATGVQLVLSFAILLVARLGTVSSPARSGRHLGCGSAA